MKTRKILTTAPVIGVGLLLLGGLLFTQCTKEDAVNPIQGTDVTGEVAINTATDWGLDKTHSSVNWKTAYFGDQAFLTGKFTSFTLDVNFDQADLANSTMAATVALNTCNTGEPGRDNLGKCLNGYLGVAHNGDTLADGSLDPAGIDANSNVASFTSDNITVYGNGYKATGDLVFKGETSTVDFIFTHFAEKDYSANQDGSRIRASFNGSFDLKAKSIHGVTSSSIADIVTVEVNGVFRK